MCEYVCGLKSNFIPSLAVTGFDKLCMCVRGVFEITNFTYCCI